MTNGLWSVRRSITARNAIPCAVIPTATAQQARKLAAFWNLTPEDQHETIVLITEDGDRSPNDQATDILRAIQGGRFP